MKKKEETKLKPHLGRIWDFRVQADEPGLAAITVTLQFFVLDATHEEAVQFAQKGMNYLRSQGGE